MKNIYKTIILLLLTTAVYSQGTVGNTPSDNDHFIGTWEASLPNNQIFRVLMSSDGEYINGHYSLLNKINGVETIVYTTILEIIPGYFVPFEFYGSAKESTLFTGMINDINHKNHKYRSLHGDLTISITSGTGDVGTVANWEVSRTPGIRFYDDDREYVIPTLLTNLTKVSNE